VHSFRETGGVRHAGPGAGETLVDLAAEQERIRGEELIELVPLALSFEDCPVRRRRTDDPVDGDVGRDDRLCHGNLQQVVDGRGPLGVFVHPDGRIPGTHRRSFVAVGDEVYGLIDGYRDGWAAEYVTIEARSLAPKPTRVDFVEAAAIPQAALTSWQALFDHGQLESGQTVVILGAEGGVGLVAGAGGRRAPGPRPRARARAGPPRPA